MNLLALLFEIGDKIIQVQMMYLLFIVLGGIGFILGFWRWWLGAVWLIFLLAIALMQIGETNYLYDAIVVEIGESYIWDSYISIIIGILLNIVGVFTNIFKTKKIILQ